MKTYYLLALLLASINLFAQNTIPPQPKRNVRFKILPGDSAVMTLNKSYNLIEDSCADILRTAHYNRQLRKFTGIFRDINKNNSAQLISEGNYDAEGLKSGMFTCYYFNGILQSKGQFVNNKPTGHWELFYETGKPHIVFDGENGTIKITSEWDEGGKQLVINGKGTHIANAGYFSWKGKLENGIPDGTWHAFKTDDAAQADVSEEHFKKGVFQKGKAMGTEYADASRIELIPANMFPYTEAEQLHVSPINCNGFGHRHIVGAKYSGGSAAYADLIKFAISSVLKGIRIRAEYGATLIIHGKVSETGNLVELTTDNPFAQDVARQFNFALRNVPPLNPATADGKPISQGFVFALTFEGGFVHYSYRFLPIRQADVQNN